MRILVPISGHDLPFPTHSYPHESEPPEIWCPNSYKQGRIPSQAHISEGKRPGLFQALEDQIYLLATLQSTEGVFGSRSLPRQSKKGTSIGHTHLPAGCNSDLHVDYCPDRAVDSLVESKVSEKATGNSLCSGSHCWISVSWESRRVLGER